jgi:branched-subunit amino acid aminotransferase/4-amino-4-deoxychorismate lyase
MKVYLNGKIVDASEALISVEDAGFQHSVGLFETMLASHGKVFRLGQHLERLAKSAQELGLARQISIHPLAEIVNQTLEANNLTEARIRLTMTAGSMSLLRPGTTEVQPTVLVVVSEPTRYDPAYFEKGVLVLVAPPGANPFDAMAGHKTLNYWPRLRTLRQAASAGAGEAIWLNVSNHLASGCVSNVFLIKDGTLFTPIARGEEVEGALPAPVLPGITRDVVLEIADDLDIPTQKKMLSVAELLDADEVFLTNSSWLILPVHAVEKKTIGEGIAGKTTRLLREKLLKRIEEEATED